MGISLAKGQSISLKKDNGSALTNATIGLGWDPAAAAPARGFFGKLKSAVTGGDIDLDASIITYGVNKQKRETIFFNHKNSKDGAIRHSGDNLTGDGDGDDEQIVIDLNRVSADVHHLVIVITSYSGQKFSEVQNVFCRIVDNGTRQEAMRYDAKDYGDHTAQVMGVISRQADGWAFKALGVQATGKTPNQLVDVAAGLL